MLVHVGMKARYPARAKACARWGLIRWLEPLARVMIVLLEDMAHPLALLHQSAVVYAMLERVGMRRPPLLPALARVLMEHFQLLEDNAHVSSVPRDTRAREAHRNVLPAPSTIIVRMTTAL